MLESLPGTIETDEEFDRLVEMMYQLDVRQEKGEVLTPHETALLERLEFLVKEYDDKVELPEPDR